LERIREALGSDADGLEGEELIADLKAQAASMSNPCVDLPELRRRSFLRTLRKHDREDAALAAELNHMCLAHRFENVRPFDAARVVPAGDMTRPGVSENAALLPQDRSKCPRTAQSPVSVHDVTRIRLLQTFPAPPLSAHKSNKARPVQDRSRTLERHALDALTAAGRSSPKQGTG